MMLHPFEIALLLGALLLLLELITGTFVIVCFSPALFVIALVEFVCGNFNPWRDTALFFLLVIGFSLVVRLIFRRRGDSKSTGSDINDY